MSAPSKPGRVRVALLGCGRVAQRVHAPILASLAGVELAAVVDPNADGKAAARRSNPAVDLADDAAPVLERDDIDAVVIALPTGMHADAAEAAFAASKHVYLEKPIAATARDAARVLAAHEGTDLVGMTGFNYRYHPLHVRLRETVRSGLIGEVTAVRSVFTTPARDLPVWKRRVASGGGVMLDLLSHHADLAAFLLGSPVVRVGAVGRSVQSEGDNAAATMTLESGVTVQTLVSMTGTEQDRFEVIGDAGTLIVDRFRNTLTHVPLRHTATTPEMTARALGLAGQAFRAVRPAMDPSYRPALTAFADAVRRGCLGDDDPSLEDGWRSLAAVLAGERSAADGGAVVSVPDRPDSFDEPEPAPEPTPEPEAAPVRDPDAPALSVVLVTIDRFETLRKVVHFVREQTIADRVQLMIVAPSEDTLADLTDEDREGFMELTAVPVGEITDVDMAAALALPHARAPYLAFLEDHAFPQPDWAEKIVAAFEQYGTAGVGTAIENGNPGTTLSWANMLMSYGQWVAAQHAGPTQNVSRHNVAFRADVLREEYGDDLPRMMGRDGGLLADLIRRGHSYAIDPTTHVRHVNPSTWSSTIELRTGSGRLFASSRMKREGWSPAKRLLYIAGAPAIPVIRYRLLRDELFGGGCDERRARLGGKANGALIVGCLLDGVGQFLGHLLGPGAIKEKMAFFEMGRARHLIASEKRIMTDLDA